MLLGDDINIWDGLGSIIMYCIRFSLKILAMFPISPPRHETNAAVSAVKMSREPRRCLTVLHFTKTCLGRGEIFLGVQFMFMGDDVQNMR